MIRILLVQVGLFTQSFTVERVKEIKREWEKRERERTKMLHRERKRKRREGEKERGGGKNGKRDNWQEKQHKKL